jgi:glycosyltransferase involved in cell wall biosynthesis
MPAISLIIPVYKVEKYIERCLRTVVAQTFTDFEVILVDDATGDASMRIAERVLGENGGIDYRIVTQRENSGLSCARNAGLDVAKGEFVYFLDSDDFLETELLERMYREIMAAGVDIVMCGARSIFENDEIPPLIDVPGIEGKVNGEKALLSLLEGKCRAYIWAQLFRRALFDDIRFPAGMIYEDRLTLPYIFLKARSVLFIQVALYNYLQRSGSITRSFRPDIYKTMGAIEQLGAVLADKFRHKEWRDAFFRYEYLNIQAIVFNAVRYSARYGDVAPVLKRVRRRVRISRLVSGYAVMKRPVISLCLFKASPRIFYYFIKKYLDKK